VAGHFLPWSLICFVHHSYGGSSSVYTIVEAMGHAKKQVYPPDRWGSRGDHSTHGKRGRQARPEEAARGRAGCGPQMTNPAGRCRKAAAGTMGRGRGRGEGETSRGPFYRPRRQLRAVDSNGKKKKKTKKNKKKNTSLVKYSLSSRSGMLSKLAAGTGTEHPAVVGNPTPS